MSRDRPNNSKPISVSSQRVELVSSILWVAFGVVVIYGTKDLEYVGEFGPSARFFPFWLGIAVIILGTIHGAQSFRINKAENDIEFASKDSAFRAVLIVIGFLGFVFLVETLGFFSASALLTFFLLYAVEKRGWKFSITTALFFFIGLYLIFDILLKVQLPTFYDLFFGA